MPFLTESVTAVITRDEAVLCEPLVYEGKYGTFTVPAGFRTDFATVPRIATAIVPKMGVHTLDAILHDWFCTGLKRGTCPVSSADADGIFRRTMRESGASFQRQWLAWAAVRWAALGKSYRRPGWWDTFPQLAGVSLVLIGTAAVVIVLAWQVGLLLGRMIG